MMPTSHIRGRIGPRACPERNIARRTGANVQWVESAIPRASDTPRDAGEGAQTLRARVMGKGAWMQKEGCQLPNLPGAHNLGSTSPAFHFRGGAG